MTPVQYPNMVDMFDEGFEDAFAYCSNDVISYQCIKNTDILERANQET